MNAETMAHMATHCGLKKPSQKQLTKWVDEIVNRMKKEARLGRFILDLEPFFASFPAAQDSCFAIGVELRKLGYETEAGYFTQKPLVTWYPK